VKRTLALLAVLGLAGCGGAPGAVDPLDGLIRPPDAKTDMDTNPANLASAVITAGLHQLPVYIDGGAFRLLPFDLRQTSEPGRTLVTRYRVTLPRTQAVVDTVAVDSPSSVETRRVARNYRVRISLDGRVVREPQRFWVFYRNNGPQICRIYFPGDLGSLQMGANSLVLRPLPSGEHVLRVEVAQEIGDRLPPARIVRIYRLHVLPRGPGAVERAIAPDEDAPPPANNTPLVLRKPAA
jgi:hypothetical protein